MLPTSDEAWISYLGRMHDRDLDEQRELNALYEGTAPLEYLQPELLRELDGRIQTVVLGWPMLAVDPLEERLDLLAFRYPEEDGEVATDQTGGRARVELASAVGDANLQRVWQDNDLDEESQMAHVDALVMKRVYGCVGSNEDDEDTPIVTFESPLEVFADIDPRTRKVRAALRRWRDDESSIVRVRERFLTLYLPDKTVYQVNNGSGWVTEHVDQHDLGEVPVVPLTNRSRLSGRYGRSELTPALLSLSNAANKIATDMMVGAEFHAIPLRAIFGIGPKDLVDEKGNPVSALQVILGKVLTLQGGENLDGGGIRAHEFTASSLSNFHSTLQQLAQHAAGLLGLDPHELGHTAGDNPASAEGLRARETRLIKRAERRQRALGGGHEKIARLIRRFQDGDWDPKAKRLEAVWRDAATPTRAQAADAAVKLFSADVIPRRQAWEDLGYTPGQQRRMQAEMDQQAEQDPVGRATKLLGQQPPPVPGDQDPAGDN
jgi:hypothetical protein